MKRIRSLLCVPAHKPALYEKAVRSGADCLMFDLEDSVPPHHKAYALETLVAYLRSSIGKIVPQVVAVRINPYTTDAGTLLDAGCRLDVLVVPKITEARELMTYEGETATVPLLPVIETPGAIVNLRSILALPNVLGGIFGVADFAAGMGVSDRRWGSWIDYGPLTNTRFVYAKQKLATYAAAFGKQALDTCFNVRDSSHVTATWRGSRSFGFTGAACIHPLQVPIANDLFGPGEIERAWAGRIHAQHAARLGEVWVDENGLVVGIPVDRQARAILKEA